jgi:hypothetical protein
VSGHSTSQHVAIKLPTPIERVREREKGGGEGSFLRSLKRVIGSGDKNRARGPATWLFVWNGMERKSIAEHRSYIGDI